MARERAVEMPVSDEDAADVLTVPIVEAQCTLELTDAADETAIDHIQSIVCAEDVETERGCANLENVGQDGQLLIASDSAARRSGI